MSLVGTSLSYRDCAGNPVILDIPATKTSVQYVICSEADQTFTEPPNVVIFEYTETTTVCAGS